MHTWNQYLKANKQKPARNAQNSKAAPRPQVVGPPVIPAVIQAGELLVTMIRGLDWLPAFLKSIHFHSSNGRTDFKRYLQDFQWFLA